MLELKKMLPRILFLIFFILSPSAQAKKVTVIGTFHGDHNRLPLYNFETLKILLQHIKPDLLLIEEDPLTMDANLKLSEAEYNKVRPIEIKKVIIPYAKQNNIKVIPTDTRVQHDEKENDSNEKFKEISKNHPELIRAVFLAYESLFADDYLFRDVYDYHSDLSMSVLEQRIQLYSQIKDLQPALKVWRQRQDQINSNLVKALKKEKYEHAVVIYGISHVPEIIRILSKAKVATLVPLKEAVKPRVPSFFQREKLIIGN